MRQAVLDRYGGAPPPIIGWADGRVLNPHHPLAPFLVGLWLPEGHMLFRNLVSPGEDEPVRQRTSTRHQSPVGALASAASSGTGAAYHVTLDTNSPLRRNAPLSLFWWGSCIGTAGQVNDRIIGVDYDAVDGSPFMCYGLYRSTTTTGATAGYNRAGTFTNSSATSGQALTSPGHGQSLALCMDDSGGASGAQPYCNGVAGTAGTSPAPTINYSANSCLRLDGPTSTRNLNMGCAMAAVFDTDLDTYWVLELHRNGGALVMDGWRARRHFAIGSSATAFTQSLSGAISPAGALVKATTKPVAGATSPAGALVKAVAKPLAGSITPAGSLANLRVKLLALAGSIGPTGSLVKVVGKNLAGAVTPAGALRKLDAKNLAGSISPAGTIANVRAKLLALAGSIGPTGALQLRTAKALSGALSPSGALSKLNSKRLTGAVSPAGAIAKVAGKNLAGALSPTGALRKAVTKLLVGVINPSGLLTSPSFPNLADADWHFELVGSRWELDIDAPRWSFDGPVLKHDLTFDVEDRWIFGPPRGE